MANEARSAELAITSLISNKREWNDCFIKFLKLQKSEVRNTSEKSEKIRAKSKKNRLLRHNPGSRGTNQPIRKSEFVQCMKVE